MAYKSIHDCGGAQNHSFFCPLDQLLGVFCVSNQNKNCWVFFFCVSNQNTYGVYQMKAVPTLTKATKGTFDDDLEAGELREPGFKG